MIHPLFWTIPIASLLALVFAYFFRKQLNPLSEGTPRMVEIADAIRKGAMSYLCQQYKVVTLVFVVLAVLFAIMAYGFHVQNGWVPFAFLTGGFFSGLAGFLGMKTAVFASARTANAARKSLNGALQIAFRSGAVTGLVVVGLGLLDISVWFLILNHFIPDGAYETEKLCLITTTMLTFGMGASTQALFARVGGGIYTKAADVGADIVGKVEADIPEDDPRNPAAIADNVGDNVGDVAGMGADLYESYCGSILAAAALGAAAYTSTDLPTQLKAVMAPMLIAAVGIVLSLVGIFAVRTHEGATMRDLIKAIERGTNLAAALVVVCAFGVLWLLDLANWVSLGGAVTIGLLVGVIIGRSTEYFTSQTYAPTRALSAAGQTGAATVVINGIGLGMLSTYIPVLAVAFGVVGAYLVATGGSFDPMALPQGLYGIALASVGMLSTLGITLATDAYGPIADNAGGNAEMSGLGETVRQRTDALDSLGNTTAATGKGFAIGSAALTGLALLASYVEEVRMGLQRLGQEVLDFGGGHVIALKDASFADFMTYYNVSLMNPRVLAGMFIGAMMAFVFCGLTMNAVGRAAEKMVEEVRRQFRTIQGILTGEGKPDYDRCVRISTRAAQHEMVVPSLIAIAAPIATGLLLGVSGVLGLLTGSLCTGFSLAVFMANAGGAWDNAKKHIEQGAHGGRGSEAHKASIVGDTVGDPFKDTSGPSLNILIKLMSMVCIVMAGLTVAWSLF